MNYKVEDLSSLTHADDLMSGFVNPDKITYGANGRRRNSERSSSVLGDDARNALETAQGNSSQGGVDVAQATNFAIDLAGQVIGAIGSKKTELERAIKASCGKRPLFGKEKKESYRTCASGVLQSFTGKSQDDRTSTDNQNNNNNTNNDDKKQGSVAMVVVSVVLGLALVTTVVVLVTKNMNKAK